MKKLTLHLIVNVQAGAGNAKKVYAISKEFLNKKNIEFIPYFTEYAGHEKKITRYLLKKILMEWKPTIDNFPLLVVLGGDGTLHEVINVLQDHPNIPIGYIPGGSGNDFARGVSLSRNTKEALVRLTSLTQPSPVKVIHAEFKNTDTKRIILNNIGIGLDANIVTTANHSKTKKLLNKLHLGSLTYLSAVFKVVHKQEAFPISFKTDTHYLSFEKAYLCSITNHPYFGGGVAIDPTASPYEDEISVVLIEKINIFEILYLAVKILSKKHLTSKYVHHFKSNQLEITSNTNQFGQTDGEIIGNEAYHVNCHLTDHLFWL